MRRLLACMMCGILLAAAAVLPQPALAQQDAPPKAQDAPRAPQKAQDNPQDIRKAKELFAVLGALQGKPLDEVIALAEKALKLEGEIRQWPSMIGPRPKMRALILNVLGHGYIQWTGGDRAENIERSLAAFEEVSRIIPREASASEWAAVQHGIGDAYQSRIRGDRADNIEKAIASYEQALTVRTRETTPVEWGATQNSLALAYRSRMRGEWADNQEKAIAALEAALTVVTRENSPADWPVMQNNLVAAYIGRVRGDRAENIEKAIAIGEAVLAVIDRGAAPFQWGQIQVNIALSYQARIRGERADNLEKSIQALETALTVLTPASAPREWAQVSNNLCTTYLSRIRGDRSENLESALRACEAALAVRTKEALPRDWADTQNNIGVIYEGRVQGSRAENLEKSIAAFEAALTVHTREAAPIQWARIQHNLANSYQARTAGDRADNLEKAISGYLAALTVLTIDSLPEEWAQSHATLGNAYVARVRGDRADNIDKAIAALEASLTIRTREAFPIQWAETHSLLGGAYWARIRDNRADNVEKAIAAYETALTVRTKEGLPREWAETQNNLGLAYEGRINGERAENEEKALAAYEAALTVKTKEALPRDWAEVQHNLANVYRRRQAGDRADNLEKGIAAYEAALTVRTRKDVPHEWADTLFNLALTYAERIRGNRGDNLNKVVAAAEDVATVKTREATPRQHLRAMRVLGRAQLELKAWSKAGQAYASAREAFLLLFGQGLNDAEARDLITEAGHMFTEAAYAAAQRGDNAAALGLATEGRARLMAVALKQRSLDLPAEKRQRLDELRAGVRDGERAAQAAEGAARAAAIEKLGRMREDLLALVKEATPAAAKPESALAQAQAIAAGGGAVVVPVVTTMGAKFIIVTAAAAKRPGPQPAAKKSALNDPSLFPQAPPSFAARPRRAPPPAPSLVVLDMPEFTLHKLIALLSEGDEGGWLRRYDVHYEGPAEMARRWPEWLDAVAGLGPELWRQFGGRLDAALKRQGLKRGARLVWMPPSALGILPLGLAQDPASKRRFADAYEIVYGPSLGVLAAAQKQIGKSAPPTLAAIINPTGDLVGTEKEGELVASHFPQARRTLLQQAAATPDAVLGALKGRTHWHFASHGTFSWGDARRSALIMHGSAPLSVDRLLEADGLGRPRLVVLSACETGLYDITRSPDEFIGLPGTFTALGAAGVLGTLWPVSDAATALLISRFYELHMEEKLAPPTALSRAQLWLRQASNADLAAYARMAVSKGRLEKRHIPGIEQELSAEGLTRSRNAAAVEWIAPDAAPATAASKPDSASRTARPYAHPYFWAGFIYTGL